MMSWTWAVVWGRVTRGDCTSGQQRIGLGAVGGEGICQSGVPYGLGRGGNWWISALCGLEMVRTAYLICTLDVHGLGMAGSEWTVFTLEGSNLPLATAAGLGVTSLFVLDSAISVIGSLKVTCLAVFLWLLGGGSATWSILVVAAKLGTWKDAMPSLSGVA